MYKVLNVMMQLKQLQEKWEPVFRCKLRQYKEIEHFWVQ